MWVLKKGSCFATRMGVSRQLHLKHARELTYCDVSVNVTTGCPKGMGPSAVTCADPAELGRVRTTLAFPDESVVTRREDSDPESVLKKIVAPCALPPDCIGFSVTERLRFVPRVPLWPSPVLLSVAGGFPTMIQPLFACDVPALSVAGTVK